MIIVLTLGRSGSSLLMQTLHRLGVDVAGNRFVGRESPHADAAHRACNPRGYHEEPDLFEHGTESRKFEELLLRKAQVACKMDLRHLIASDQFRNWGLCENRIDRVLISFREPAEQAHSWFVAHEFADQDMERARFQFITSFLRDYVQILRRVEKVLATELQVLSPRVDWVDYHLAQDSDAYVSAVSDAVSPCPSVSQIAGAKANITQTLYRNRRSDLNAEELCWAEALGATSTYQRLSAFSRTESLSNCTDLIGRV